MYRLPPGAKATSVMPRNGLPVFGTGDTEMVRSFLPVWEYLITLEAPASKAQIFPEGSILRLCGNVKSPLPQERRRLPHRSNTKIGSALVPRCITSRFPSLSAATPDTAPTSQPPIEACRVRCCSPKWIVGEASTRLAMAASEESRDWAGVEGSRNKAAPRKRNCMRCQRIPVCLTRQWYSISPHKSA